MPDDLPQSVEANIVSNVAKNPQDTQSVDEQQKFFDFSLSKSHLKRLIDDWSQEIEDTDVRRKERKVEVDVEALRQKGEIGEDETLVPVRVIDNNITREQPPYINYLKNSRRVAIFGCVSDPDQSTDLLEQDFTRVATYTSWETSFYKEIDGSQAHGTDGVEVVYDTKNPGAFSIEQIGHDKLIFPRSAIDIQECPRVIRIYDVSILQLQSWVAKYGFSEKQVELIRSSKRDNKKEQETTRIYKLFFKVLKPETKAFCVYVAWFALSDGCTDWLKEPVEHYVGIDEQTTDITGQSSWVPKKIDQYPIFILPYKLSEEQRIIDARGRGFLDGYKQEAHTALWSAFVNGMSRASNIYGSPGTEDGTGGSLRELEDVKLLPNRFMSKPVEFWSPPYPDPMVLKTLQYMDVSNSQETGQVDFAAMNREDSRKTAKEIGSAEKQQVMLNSVQLTLFSTHIRQVYSFCWLIVQSQALQNKIPFLRIKQQIPRMNPVVGTPMIDPQTQQPVMDIQWVNDVATIGKIYDVRAAGDVDVIQRGEMEQKMQQDFPLVMQTALKDAFLLDYVKLRYPDKGDRYSQILASQGGQMQQLTGLVGQLVTILEGALKDNPHMLDTLPMEARRDLVTTIKQAHAVIGQEGNGAQ